MFLTVHIIPIGNLNFKLKRYEIAIFGFKGYNMEPERKVKHHDKQKKNRYYGENGHIR